MRQALGRLGSDAGDVAQISSALARETEARSPRGLWLNRARDLVGGIARALDAEPAGEGKAAAEERGGTHA